jgi:glycosyltransferase involved in cell wall biosynthesis
MSAIDEKRVAVSVVVPVYNSIGTVGRTLGGLAGQSLATNYEVLIVDGGSDDGTRELLERAGDSITLLHNPAREPASSRNLGVARARADVIAFTDGDCEPDPDWLEQGLGALEGADIVQGRVLPLEARGPFDRSLAVSSEYGLYETANLFIRREVFERTGGFEILPGLDLPHGAHFGEDAWLVWRAKRQGARTAFCMDSVVRHAVVTRGIRAMLRESLRRRYFPTLIRTIPELRDAFLHRRWFLSPVTLHFDLALIGALLATSSRRPLALLLALPYGADRWSELRRHPPLSRPWLLAGRLADDTVGFGSQLWGSLRTRTIVL